MNPFVSLTLRFLRLWHHFPSRGVAAAGADDILVIAAVVGVTFIGIIVVATVVKAF